MQKIIFTELESEQSQSPVRVNNPVGTLVFGLLLGLVLTVFERRNQPHLRHAQSERTGGWGRTFVFLCLLGLALFVIVNLVMGP